MALQLDHLGLLDAPVDLLDGVPMQLPLDLIDEDPQQPRNDFNAETLQELAVTIRERGVRQPISVRRHPDQPGRWMLNFGARRLRASKLAGKSDIPAFVDEAVDGYDQVIENEQRDGLKPFELALFVKKQLAAGQSQFEIAGQLGKSQTYISFISALIDPPDWLLAAYRDGKCRGVKALGDLRKLHEAQPTDVLQWLAGRAFVSRSDVEEFRNRQRDGVVTTSETAARALSTPTAQPASVIELHSESPVLEHVNGRSRKELDQTTQSVAPQAGAALAKSVRVEAEFEGVIVLIVLDELPAVDGEVFVELRPGVARRSVMPGELRRVRVVVQ